MTRTAVASRWADADHPFVFEINTWPWLRELSVTAGQPVDLGSVPDEQWDTIADNGFDAVWLTGVWQRSPAGVAIALQNADLVADFEVALPDFTPDDVVGSPYCIRDYRVDAALGGPAGLAAARAALAKRGVGLLLDFVPNHVAPDHPWTTAHPELFVHGSVEDLRSDPSSFVEVAGTILANGRDPHFAAWPDVVQLDAFAPALRSAAIDVLRMIADQCDGVRCDMAMLMMNDTFARTWGSRVGDRPTDDYWPTVIPAVRETHPGFTFIAEAYWDLERQLQQQGFDFCYDKRLYDHLRHGDGEAVLQHVRADTDYQNKLLRFVENHDEPRAAEVFGRAQLKAVTVTTLTQTGARLVHDGQIEGRRVRLPVFLGRFPDEPVDRDLADFHRSLLAAVRDRTFRTGSWQLCDRSGRPGNATVGKLVAWCWTGEHRWLIVVNLGDEVAGGHVKFPWKDAPGSRFRLADATGGITLELSDAVDGFHVELEPWHWHFFRVEADR